MADQEQIKIVSMNRQILKNNFTSNKKSTIFFIDVCRVYQNLKCFKNSNLGNIFFVKSNLSGTVIFLGGGIPLGNQFWEKCHPTENCVYLYIIVREHHNIIITPRRFHVTQIAIPIVYLRRRFVGVLAYIRYNCIRFVNRHAVWETPIKEVTRTTMKLMKAGKFMGQEVNKKKIKYTCTNFLT